MKILFSIIIGALFGAVFYTYHIDEINLLLRTLGYISFALLSLSLIVSPSASLLAQPKILPYRKIMGLLAFFVALAHSSKYFFDEYTYNKTIFVAKHFLELDVLSGTVSLILMLILGVTSLRYFIRLLGVHWKSLQSLIFPLYCIASAHIAFASRFDIGYMIMISAVVLLRTLAYLNQSPVVPKAPSKTAKTSKVWLCVPCGYIYNPQVGDRDSGIAPGTPFEDIPDTWMCPVCGVTKADFIQVDATVESTPSLDAVITSHELLNPTTLQMSIRIPTRLISKVGQYIKFTLHDKDGGFSRCYSIVEQSDDVFTFCIKLKSGRAARILAALKNGDNIKVDGIYGNFQLQDTNNPKVFIASGTGLAPILRMLKTLDSQVQKVLYFSVSHGDELFYIDELKAIANLTLHIHVTQESVPGYGEGRISLEHLGFAPDTEFYLCGAPGLVSDAVDKLQTQGYTRIYSEKF